MDIEKIEKIATSVMVGCALLGTLWYLILEWQSKEELSAIGWSVIAVVWFIVYRRLLHQWRTKRKDKREEDHGE